MADKKMEYTGTAPLEIVLPSTGQVVSLAKGDQVSFTEYGGQVFFQDRKDFKPVATTGKTRKGKAG